jgi:hypothetical protein
MAHQSGPDTLSLVLVDHGESHLRLSGLQNDVTSATDDESGVILRVFPDCDDLTVVTSSI